MEKILVVYWSQTGNTEAMANAIVEGIQSAGGEAVLETVDAQPDVKAYDKIAFGCPSSGAEELEESEFEPYFAGIEGDLANKKVVLFGSYGWGAGEWMDSWKSRTEAAQAMVFKTSIINYTPDDGGLEECKQLGEEFTKLS